MHKTTEPIGGQKHDRKAISSMAVSWSLPTVLKNALCTEEPKWLTLDKIFRNVTVKISTIVQLEVG